MSSFTKRAKEKLGFGKKRKGIHSVKSISHGVAKNTAQFYPSASNPADDVHKKLQFVNAVEGEQQRSSTSTLSSQDSATNGVTINCTENPKRNSRGMVRPKGTLEHVVSGRETLSNIAAHYDVTPSDIAKISRLLTRTVFPGQVLYIPDKDYVPSPQTSPVGSSSGTGSPTGTIPMDMVNPGQKQEVTFSSGLRSPGHAERMSPPSFPLEDAELVEPLSEEDARRLDEECHERFIKIYCKQITDRMGSCRGVLLVTPNAIMFDPDVSDPLIIESGADNYGLIAPMEMVVSVAMYHDISHMRLRSQLSDEHPCAASPKPAVYHARDCAMHKYLPSGSPPGGVFAERESDGRTGETLSPSQPQPDDNLLKANSSGRDRTVSECSCGALPSLQVGDNRTVAQGEPDNVRFDVGETETEENQPVDDRCPSTDQANNELDVQSAMQGTPSNNADTMPVNVSFEQSDTDVESRNIDTTASQPMREIVVDDRGIVDHSSDAFDISQPLEVIRDLSAKSTGACAATCAQDNLPEGNVEDEAETNVDGDEQPVGSRQHATQRFTEPMEIEDGNPKSESQPRLQRKISGSLKKLGSTISHAGTTISHAGSSLSTASSTSFHAFVDFSSGLFSKNQDECERIKDVLDLPAPSTSPPKLSARKVGSSKFYSGSPPKASSTARLACTDSEGSVHRELNPRPKSDVQIHSAVSMEEKPGLFQPIDELLCRRATSPMYEDPPLFLCLRLGQPINKVVSKTCPIEAFSKTRKKPEYWFSIPRDRVDQLYAFFIQWSPNLYGDEEVDPKGFVLLNWEEDEDAQLVTSLEVSADHYSHELTASEKKDRYKRTMSKDWEIIKVEEARRRIPALEVEDSLPLPDLIGTSIIMEVAHVEKLCKVLPPRAEGYPWSLVYSTEQHGFSIKTMFRSMEEIDSPILLLVQDTDNNVFGAITSCEYQISDHFYGRGESFLFTFTPEFKVFKWSGDNNFFIKSNLEYLAIGAGEGVFGLWVDADLYHGRTECCQTFNNDPLTVKHDFLIKSIEAWSFQ